jgi:hypothetical protein
MSWPMPDRTLDSFTDTMRKPSYEMQQAALAAGYGSVRDWALEQCIAEIRLLKERVDALESGGEIVEEG